MTIWCKFLSAGFQDLKNSAHVRVWPCQKDTYSSNVRSVSNIHPSVTPKPCETEDRVELTLWVFFFLQIRRIKKKLVNLVFWYIINKWYMVFSLIRAEENGLKMGGGQGPQEVYYIGKRPFLLHNLCFLTIFRDGKPNWTTCYMSFILKWNFVIVLIEWSANWCNIRDLLNMWPLSDSKINSYFCFINCNLHLQYDSARKMW